MINQELSHMSYIKCLPNNSNWPIGIHKKVKEGAICTEYKRIAQKNLRNDIIKNISEITNISIKTLNTNSKVSLLLHPFNLKVEMLVNLYFELKLKYRFIVNQNDIERFAFETVDSICDYIERNSNQMS